MKNEDEFSDKYFKLFASCVPVRGAKRSVICDLQREPNYYFIPNNLYTILETCNIKSYNELLSSYNKVDRITIEEYFSFLINHELGFWCNFSEISLFPEVEYKWDFPAKISNAIIDSNSGSEHDYNIIFKELLNVGCSNIQLRFYDSVTFEEMNSILMFTNNVPIFYIELFIKYDKKNVLAEWKLILRQYPSIGKIIFHSAPTDQVEVENENGFGNIFLVRQNILSEAHCGFVHQNYFISNIQLFSEGKNSNSCLNRKISIDVNGYIKNCPAMQNNYGHYKNVVIHDIVDTQNYQIVSSITKDQIEICQECEFRYMCTDCRAFLVNPDNLYSKPLKCGYDPYTNEWEDWSKNPIKQKTFENYKANLAIKPS